MTDLKNGSVFLTMAELRQREQRRRENLMAAVLFAFLVAMTFAVALLGCGSGTRTNDVTIGVTPLPICPEGTIGVEPCAAGETQGLCLIPGTDGGPGTPEANCAIDKMPAAFACVEACP